MKKLFLISPIFLLLAACGPSTYEECILDNIKGVNNDKVLHEVRRACRGQFPVADDFEAAAPAVEEAPAPAVYAPAPAFPE